MAEQWLNDLITSVRLKQVQENERELIDIFQEIQRMATAPEYWRQRIDVNTGWPELYDLLERLRDATTDQAPKL
jgi:hypothetical protein